MLIKPLEWLTKNENKRLPHIGTVVENNDPLKLERLRIKITDLLEKTEKPEKEDLPWIYPWKFYFLGTSCEALPMMCSEHPGNRGKSDTIHIPEIGSRVTVIFPFDGDPYTGFYTGTWKGTPDRDPTLEKHYPESYGFKDSRNNWFRIDKEDGFIDFHHHSGSHIQINDKGDINIYSVRDINIKADRDITMMAKRNIEQTSQVDTKVAVNANLQVNVSGWATHTVASQSLFQSTGSNVVDKGISKTDVR